MNAGLQEAQMEEFFSGYFPNNAAGVLVRISAPIGAIKEAAVDTAHEYASSPHRGGAAASEIAQLDCALFFSL